MQYHHHGYVPHDPRIKKPQGTGIDRAEDLPDKMDVLIVGAGPSGIVQAAQLTNYPNVHTRIIESRPGRLEMGRADGVFSRSSETFQAFEFQDRIESEAHFFHEMKFWGPHPENPKNIVRGARAASPPAGVSEFPVIIVNQARVIDYFTEYAENGPAKIKINFGYEFLRCEIHESDEYPVHVWVTGPDGSERKVQTKYLVGSDGARSRVRAMTDIEVDRDAKSYAWAVMDVLAETDFPDVRSECGIQSDQHGSILLIPREGGFLVRYYVSLDEVTDETRERIRSTKIDEVIEQANKILHPYTLDVREVAWYSVYEARHRVAQKFDNVPLDRIGIDNPRIFITGDACHTHSAKAGQGMNISIQDGWNLAWKLGQVLEGLSDPSLLATYSEERQDIAQKLIDFDKEWQAMMSKRSDEFSSPTEISDFYENTAEFMGGFMTEYQPSRLTGTPENQHLATGYPIGKRFKSSRVSRVPDTSTRHLGHHFRADGRWRLYTFAGSSIEPLNEFAEWLEFDNNSPVRKFTLASDDIDGLFDVKVIYQRPYQEIDLGEVPSIFLPKVGPFRLIDYEKVYSALPGEDIFDERGIDREQGALVVVRPDMYVANIFPLTAREEITDFFENILLKEEADEWFPQL